MIPARGGSKGLPKKNVRPLCGKPLLAWSINTAQEVLTAHHGRVVVSTDDPEIASIAKIHGAEVPFLRPSSLALDTTPSMDVVLHAITWFEGQGEQFDFVVMLEPTSPQRDAADILAALGNLAETADAESIVGIGKLESAHPAFVVSVREAGFIRPYQDQEIKVLRRQDLDDLYFFEGSLYISKIDSVKKRKSFYHEKTLGLIMPKWKTFEIDDLTDFILIEALMSAKLRGELK